ncbi:hypothetical protein M440DRAFT_188490 [Trichoderma longibrachiatum ATCC 18648]|uniref:Uncharacterized protein n=1 Tax=Trichoderma longibrachiatum ATCC 18648 TaxID=983965 RepID=A0A2T4CFB6_TRILO|nr:hypothetical protein M440DRAFT_188490 [Trichoderma longibrachiatum ATCC 18648]
MRSDMELLRSGGSGAQPPDRLRRRLRDRAPLLAPCSLSCASLRLSLTEVFHGIGCSPHDETRHRREFFICIWGSCIIGRLSFQQPLWFLGVFCFILGASSSLLPQHWFRGEAGPALLRCRCALPCSAHTWRRR